MTPSELEKEITSAVESASWALKPLHSQYFGKMAILQIVLTVTVTGLVLAMSAWFGVPIDHWTILALIVPIYAVVWTTTVYLERWLETDFLEDVIKARSHRTATRPKPGRRPLGRP